MRKKTFIGIFIFKKKKPSTLLVLTGDMTHLNLLEYFFYEMPFPRKEFWGILVTTVTTML